MKNLLLRKFVLYSLTVIFLFIAYVPQVAFSQNKSKTSPILRITTNYFLNPDIRSDERSSLNNLQKNLFYKNPSISFQLDKFVSNHIAISPGISINYASKTRDESVVYVVAPPPGTISNFKTDYNFFFVSFEPKVKLFLNYYDLDFFWTAGPIVSYGRLSASTDGAPYGDRDNFRFISKAASNAFGFGAYGSTGIQINFNRRFGLAIEAGYTYLKFTKFTLEETTGFGSNDSFNYSVATFTPGIGMTFKL